ncbi:hypothetical protein RF240_09450 [Dickeya dadantii]|uniref:hypothetical protein n=1 Tax=Dickeya dadantii TaxID=204038 RepID=UPI001C12DE5E|nr:hypothetical protein [Dickeya dadantii]
MASDRWSRDCWCRIEWLSGVAIWYYYSMSNSGFYSKDVNGANIPDDAVEISDDYYQHLLNEQALGNTIIFDELVKKPIAVTKPVHNSV